nr:hypothetical protein Q903MT_gene6130 [Picea sitchensis]
MAIHNNPPASASYAQPAQPPNQTSNVHSVQTVNNQQAGGKKNTRKIRVILDKGAIRQLITIKILLGVRKVRRS